MLEKCYQTLDEVEQTNTDDNFYDNNKQIKAK
ncbi:hypothetical protein SAG0136_08355 [Streptococcus agalactiae LMG 14747]|uniref:Uncharacterized protein n=1 Tax=Streptococcus agalactiae LMG 14747 TaxID=1154860 RepID=V6Z4J9_STRAG|nr:hypothetical protein SAG0136_08355 [Streptococcus agalactiae LMG 14747]